MAKENHTHSPRTLSTTCWAKQDHNISVMQIISVNLAMKRFSKFQILNFQIMITQDMGTVKLANVWSVLISVLGYFLNSLVERIGE